jgi:hypothetical protein
VRRLSRGLEVVADRTRNIRTTTDPPTKCAGTWVLTIEPAASSAGMAMVPEGLDMAVRLMVPGEVSTVHAAPGYAYDGHADRPEVCASSHLYVLPLLRM